MKNKTFLKKIFIVALYIFLANHLTAEELTDATVELVYIPKFLPALADQVVRYCYIEMGVVDKVV